MGLQRPNRQRRGGCSLTGSGAQGGRACQPLTSTCSTYALVHMAAAARPVNASSRPSRCSGWLRGAGAALARLRWRLERENSTVHRPTRPNIVFHGTYQRFLAIGPAPASGQDQHCLASEARSRSFSVERLCFVAKLGALSRLRRQTLSEKGLSSPALKCAVGLR